MCKWQGKCDRDVQGVQECEGGIVGLRACEGVRDMMNLRKGAWECTSGGEMQEGSRTVCECAREAR